MFAAPLKNIKTHLKPSIFSANVCSMGKNVIIVASEAAPFVKTGGLADVAGSLPVALKKLGCRPVIFLPYYRRVADGGFDIEPTGLEVTVPIGRREITGQVLKGSKDGVPVYFIRRDEYFDRGGVYGTPEGDYFDNIERFAFFSRGVLEVLKARGFDPDIIHCNDWQTGLIPAYLKDTYKNDLYFSSTSTVFTVHNAAYQGLFPADLFELTGLSPAVFTSEGLEFWGKMNFLKAGLVYSDIITTVSKAYSQEIQTAEYGWGLDGVLRGRKHDLYGILNGVDYGEWDPKTDPLIPENYSSGDLKGKAKCKKELIKAFGLKVKQASPVIGIVSRLAAQKGLDILAEAMPELMKLDVGVAVLGTGDRLYQTLMEELAEKYPGRLSVKIAFDNGLSHLVEAGSDIFLMPSRYEPCGLNQMYSLRYGTVPVVRATGGLDDTVREFGSGEGNGFKFAEYSAAALAAKVKEAVDTFKDKKAWDALRINGMKEDFSWEASAARYMEIYDRCLKLKHYSLKNAHP